MVQNPFAKTGVPFVGRETEVAHLRDLLDRAAPGTASPVLVSGPPGIGKTRLLNEVARLAANQGFRPVWGRCWEAGGAPAYWPWTQALRAALRETHSGVRSSGLGAILPELVDPEGDRAEGDPAAARFRLFAAVADTLGKLADERPLLIILDDLHEADEPSLLLLRSLVSGYLGSTVAILGAFRDPDPEASPDWQVPPTLLDLARQPGLLAIRLRGLESEHVADFILSSTGQELDQNLIYQIQQETEGNPLFLGELVRLLEFEGKLKPGSNVDLLEMRLPPTVSEAIARRLRSLSSEVRRLLALGAILGRDFDLRALSVLAGQNAAELERELEDAARMRLIVAAGTGEPRWRFGHALIRDALYQEIHVVERQRLHLAAGSALENLYETNLDEHLAELAFHYASGPEEVRRDRGVTYSWRAARRAVAQLAFEEGVRLYRLSLAILQELATSDLDAQAEALLALGDAQARSGDTPAAQRSFLAAADFARRLGDAGILARAALGYGGRLVWATPRGDANLVPLLREALAGVHGERLRCRLLARLSGALREDFDVTERDRLSREAVEIARGMDDPAALAYALSARYPAIWGPDNLEERFAVGAELLEVGRSASDQERIFHGHTQRLYVELERGEMTAAREDLNGARRIARELSQPSQLWLTTAIEAQLAIFEGKLIEAERLAYRAHALGLRASRSSADIAFAMQLAILRREQRRLPEVEPLIEATVGAYAASYPVLLGVEVWAKAELGAFDQARQLLQSLGREGFAALPRNDEWLPALTLVAVAAAKLPDSGSACSWLNENTALYADRNVLGNPELLYGSHSRTLGVLAFALGRTEEAIAHYERALAANLGWGSKLWAAHARLGLAEGLIKRAEDSDHDEARSLLTTAIAEAQTLPSALVQSEAERLQDLLESTRDGTGGPPVQGAPATAAFRCEGDSWHIEFEERSIRIKDARGLHYLAQLLGRPGEHVHALQLASEVAGGVPQTEPNVGGLRTGRLGGPGESLVDSTALEAYKARLSELEADISEAEDWNDPERAARASEERDFLVRELTAAFGLARTPRGAPDPGERARQSATKAVKATIKRIAALHPPLGAHLEVTVRTGTYFSYTPDPRLPICWQL